MIPQCVYSSHNTDGAGVIVFKNSCSDTSFQDCSDPEGMSLPEILTVVKAMAKFHAAGRAFLARNQIQVRTFCISKYSPFRCASANYIICNIFNYELHTNFILLFQAVKRRYPYLKDDMYCNSSFVQEVNGHLTTYDDFLKTAAQELEGTSPHLSPKQELQHANYMQHNLSHESLLEARYC